MRGENQARTNKESQWDSGITTAWPAGEETETQKNTEAEIKTQNVE